jgi:Flp pilus assembly protein TadG
LQLKRAEKRKRGERAQVLVEFALVAVVFFTVLFGIMDMARLFQSWLTVQHAARESARYAITGRSNCTGAANRDACIKWTAKDMTTGMERGGPNALDADVAVTFQAWDKISTGWSGSASANKSGKQCDQLEVKVTYTHKFMTPILTALMPAGVQLNGMQRMTNEPYGICTDGDGTG